MRKDVVSAVQKRAVLANQISSVVMFLLVLVTSGYGQYTTFYSGFEDDDLFDYLVPDSVTYVMEQLRPQWADGIDGRSLDLSADAVLRRPVLLDSTYEFTADSLADLTGQIWIRTKKHAAMGTPIMGNVGGEDREGKGWMIYSRSNGSWGLQLNDGQKMVQYEPTERQAINDGEWHHLAFSLDRTKGEIWFYFDGKNVGIYQLGTLGSLESSFRTAVGGSDSYWKWGSSGQWTAFNGYIDEVRIENKKWSSVQVEEEYRKYRSIQDDSVLEGPLRVMTWNIWHGGRRFGQHVGVNRVIETIKEARPDVVGLIETYGSGEIIADSLGYYYYLISRNLSIMSRFPIKSTIQAFRPFNFGGAVLDVGKDREIAVLDTWLHYLPRTPMEIKAGKFSAEELIEAEGETRHAEVQQILKEIEAMQFGENTPVFFVGDFNSGSHLDWTAYTRDIHYDYVLEWPVSKAVLDAGFKDSYRELHIDELRDPGFTWTPIAAKSTHRYELLRDRIDYIYYRGPVRPIESKVIDYHPVMFPSDHAAVLSVFEWK